jgi:nucleoside 2-deoxyribosyltransferase
MKKIYIAAPFFNPEQLALVMEVESAISAAGLALYSPRHDGVLKDMTPEQRVAAGPELFKLNCRMIRECDSVLALKDYSDTGTTWETGFAYGVGQFVFGYKRESVKPLNIMVAQCFNCVIYGKAELERFLRAYASNDLLDEWSGRDLKDTY